MAGEAAAVTGGATGGASNAGSGAGSSGSQTASGAGVSQNGGASGSAVSTPAQNSGGGAPAAAPASDWTSGFNDEFKGYVQNKGWKAPQEALESYRNLEKLIGAPQDKIIKLPNEDDAQGWESVYSRLGKPANPEAYKFDTSDKSPDPEFTKWAADTFFKNNLNEKQAKSLAEAWNEKAKASVAQREEARQVKATQEAASLKKEWGGAFENNVSIAKRASREFGVEPKVIDAMEKEIGFAATMKFFQNIGSKMGEASYTTGRSDQGSGNGPMTPAQAKDMISGLKQDQEFIKKLTGGDVAARQKWDHLHKFAFGEF